MEKAWEWKRQYGGRIQNQLKKIGASAAAVVVLGAAGGIAYITMFRTISPYLIENGIADQPFSREHPAVQLKVRMARVQWDCYPGQPGVCAELPGNRTGDPAETLYLQPYGCTTLRMTLMPRCGE